MLGDNAIAFHHAMAADVLRGLGLAMAFDIRTARVYSPCDRKSSGEENEHDVLKPFIAIQRV